MYLKIFRLLFNDNDYNFIFSIRVYVEVNVIICHKMKGIHHVVIGLKMQLSVPYFIFCNSYFVYNCICFLIFWHFSYFVSGLDCFL